jgi:hypothetical protein
MSGDTRPRVEIELTPISTFKHVAPFSLEGTKDVFLETSLSDKDIRALSAVQTLEYVSPSLRWIEDELAEKPLGVSLIMLRQEVDLIVKESYFVPGGVKKLNTLFKQLDANPLKESEKQRTINFLKAVLKIAKARLALPIRRGSSVENLYKRILTELNSRKSEYTSDNEISKKDLTAPASIPDAEEVSLEAAKKSTVFSALEALFSMPLWDRQARSILGRAEVPSGIKKIRNILLNKTWDDARKVSEIGFVVFEEKINAESNNNSEIVNLLYTKLYERLPAPNFSSEEKFDNASFCVEEKFEIKEVRPCNREKTIEIIEAITLEINEALKPVEAPKPVLNEEARGEAAQSVLNKEAARWEQLLSGLDDTINKSCGKTIFLPIDFKQLKTQFLELDRYFKDNVHNTRDSFSSLLEKKASLIQQFNALPQNDSSKVFYNIFLGYFASLEKTAKKNYSALQGNENSKSLSAKGPGSQKKSVMSRLFSSVLFFKKDRPKEPSVAEKVSSQYIEMSLYSFNS